MARADYGDVITGTNAAGEEEEVTVERRLRVKGKRVVKIKGEPIRFFYEKGLFKCTYVEVIRAPEFADCVKAYHKSFELLYR